jgi:hypothetical protein
MNTPGVLMSFMNVEFHEYLEKFVKVFIDDILIYYWIKAEHEEHLRLVLHFIRENKLYGKLLKCLVYLSKIHYLRHIIYGEGVVLDPTKVEAIMEWTKSKNVQ